MEEGGDNLDDHGHPCDVHAVQESLLQVKLTKEIASDETDLDVSVRMLDHLGLLS